ncbi:hypothetical protein CPT_Summit_136 [Stenotrophomonas phage Summit]|nr:hypothetical protein CPT_Summit_136 [Stenotrophomonas phage Summit]
MKTTLSKAAHAATLVIIENIEQNGCEVFKSGMLRFDGADEISWLLNGDQEIEIDAEGRAVAQDDEGSLNMEFRVSHPLTEDDLKEGSRDPAGKRLVEGYKALRAVIDKGQFGQSKYVLDKVQIEGILGLLSGEFEGVY